MSKYDTKDKVHQRALDSIGLTLGEIDKKNEKNVKNKSYPGNVIEQIWFDHPADNISKPDFPEAGIELKVTPLDKRTKTIKKKKVTHLIAGERLVLNKINYKNEYNKLFEESSFWNKNKIIELIQYYRRDTKDKPKFKSGEKTEDKTKFKILYANLLTFSELEDFNLDRDTVIEISESDFQIIKQDWEKISNLINNSKAEDLTEGMTNYLGACTKSATGSDFTTQYGSSISPKPRAYSFKTAFINKLINDHIIGEDHDDAISKIITDVSEIQTESLEDIILSRFKPYFNKTQNELITLLKLDNKLDNKNLPKHINSILVRAILNLNLDLNNTDEIMAEELIKADIKLKTVELVQNESKENFKFMEIPSFEELTKETWEQSEVLDYLEKTKLLLLVFNRLINDKNDPEYNNPKNIVFVGAKFWNMSAKDIYGSAQNIWQSETQKIKHGVTLTYVPTEKGYIINNNFIKPTLENFLCLRPSASLRQYRPKYRDSKGKLKNNSKKLPSKINWINRPLNMTDELTDYYITKQAWWLSKEYIYEQIKDLLL